MRSYSVAEPKHETTKLTRSQFDFRMRAEAERLIADARMPPLEKVLAAVEETGKNTVSGFWTRESRCTDGRRRCSSLSLGRSASKVAKRSVEPVAMRCCLAVDIVEHPDAAGTVFHRQHEFVLGQRKRDEVNLMRDHQARILECIYGRCWCRHTEGFSNWLSVSWIEADSPDVVHATPGRNEVNRLPIGRLTRLIVPISAVCNSDPRSAQSGHHVKSGFYFG
jgi:hypothetical protein